MRCFMKVLSELKDKAGQHELIAEDLQSSIIKEISQLVKTLKEERKKVFPLSLINEVYLPNDSV